MAVVVPARTTGVWGRKSMSEDQSKTPEMSKLGEILYRVFFDELRFAKQQQFTTTNYTLLLMAGLFAIARVISPATLGKITLCGLVILAWALGLLMLFDLHGYILELRRRQKGMERKFSPEDQKLARGEEPSDGERSAVESIYQLIRRLPILGELEPFLVVLCLVMTIAGILAGSAIAAL
jgi:hypothetical protein